MSTEILERAFASTRSVLVNVRPDDLERPTPCASWDVRALVNHIVGGTHYFAASVNAGSAPDALPVDFASGDMVASFDDGAAQAIAAFGAPGALREDGHVAVRHAAGFGVHRHRGDRHVQSRLGPRARDRSAERSRSRARGRRCSNARVRSCPTRSADPTVRRRSVPCRQASGGRDRGRRSGCLPGPHGLSPADSSIPARSNPWPT